MTKNLKWRFEEVNPVDYLLTIKCDVENKLMVSLFGKAKQRLSRTKGIKLNADPNVIQSFKVDRIYYHVLKTFLNSTIKKIRREINQDKLDFLSHNIKTADFIRKPDQNWMINIEFEGQYIDKR